MLYNASRRVEPKKTIATPPTPNQHSHGRTQARNNCPDKTTPTSKPLGNTVGPRDSSLAPQSAWPFFWL
jgi:hypothetical protein